MNTIIKQRKKTVLDRNCLHCDKALEGRLDKRFCDDYCRSAYNNTIKAPVRPLSQKITQTLTKNRKILRKMLGDRQHVNVLKSDMERQGFNFEYLTRFAKGETGTTYFYCYEFQYRCLDGICEVTRELRFFKDEKTYL